MQAHPPETFWVCGLKTNVGKTTVAAALIRLLNQRGSPTLGFKPFVGGRLRDLVDFAWHHFPSQPGKVFGSDGLILAQASPLTREVDVDLVTPRQLIYYRSSADTLLMRTGSAALGNVEYFKPTDAGALLRRSDILRLAEQLHLPLDRAREFDPRLQPRSELGAGAANAAFGALLQRRPEVVVIEGAGPYLPLWPGNPPLQHLVLVTDDVLVLYPDVNVTHKPEDTPGRLWLTTELLARLEQRGHASHACPHPIVESASRMAALAEVLGDLLERGGVLDA